MTDIDPFSLSCDDDGAGEPLPTVGEELRDMWKCFRRRAHVPAHRNRHVRRAGPRHPMRVHRRPGSRASDSRAA